MSLIAFENVTLGYEGQPVVRGLSFSVSKGDCLCVIGENGSGKSTTMKAILGFVAPMSGKILRDKKLKNAIGYLPQQQSSQMDFPASVNEVVLSGFQGKKKFLSIYTASDRRTAAENMAKLNITQLSDRSFKDLSGGQKQRVLLARALCAADDLLLLDEPVAGLDAMATAELYDVISKLNREGMTVIMITHDTERAISNATHILELGSEKQFFGTAAKYAEQGGR